MRGEETVLATLGAVAVSIDPSLTIPAIATVAAAAVGALVAWSSARLQHRGKPENALIDQLQEEQATMREDITTLKTDARASLRREYVRDNYIRELRHHIDSGKPPPPPPWPPELTS